MVMSILMCLCVIIVFLAFLFLSIRAEINIRYRGDLRKDYNLAGKWGADILQGNYQDFIQDFLEQDRIVLYDSECYITNMYYIPMWDNEARENYDFIRLIPYVNTNPFAYPKEVCKVFHRHPVTISNCIVTLQQFEMGNMVNKDKLYPLYHICINTKNEHIAYNIDRHMFYILSNKEILDFCSTYTNGKSMFNNLYYIHSGNMQHEKDRYNLTNPWTFNLECTRTKSEIVTILPPIRLSTYRDGFELILNQEQEERLRNGNI